jgi:FtsP/CotA-like multicopper oxidase with cupredoxin domain
LAASSANAGDNMAGMKMTLSADDAATGTSPGCNGTMGTNVTNIHFHGTNVAPVCGQDEVVHTLVQPGQSFDYDVQIPTNEPPELYWYHPHPHGISEGRVQGGATGALIVEGLQNVDTALAGQRSAPSSSAISFSRLPKLMTRIFRHGIYRSTMFQSPIRITRPR